MLTKFNPLFSIDTHSINTHFLQVLSWVKCISLTLKSWRGPMSHHKCRSVIMEAWMRTLLIRIIQLRELVSRGSVDVYERSGDDEVTPCKFWKAQYYDIYDGGVLFLKSLLPKLLRNVKQGCAGRCKRIFFGQGAWGRGSGGWGRARQKCGSGARPQRGEAVRRWECHQTRSFSF